MIYKNIKELFFYNHYDIRSQNGITTQNIMEAYSTSERTVYIVLP